MEKQMTKRRMQALKKAIVHLTQSIKMNSSQYVLSTPQIPLTLIFGKPPNAVAFQYLAPYELAKNHLDKAPEEIMNVIPWEAINRRNNCDDQRIENDFLELLILCPSDDEFSEFRIYLKEIKVKFNMPNKLNEIQKEAIEEQTIKKNLKELALPIFKDAIKTWKDVKKIKKSLPELIEKVLQQPFSPQESDTLDIAYERLLLTYKLKNYQYYSLLIDAWKHDLKRSIFEGSHWSFVKQQYFFSVWERTLFKKSPPKLIPMKTRWQQAQTIDRYTAGKVIKYFLDLYISKDNPISGCFACILWILIAVSKHLPSSDAHIRLADIVVLSKESVNIAESTIKINETEFPISRGLTGLLSILSDVKYGKRGNELFSGITVDRLEDALKKASKELFGFLITPQAFLTFPHPFEGTRIAPSLLQGVCEKDAFALKPDARTEIILRPFKLPIHHKNPIQIQSSF